MIRSLHLENYKCHADLRVEGLRRLTLVGGKNNVGKTALLEALFMADDHANPSLLVRHFLWRGIPAVAARPDAMWAPSFHRYDLDRAIIVSWEDDAGNKEKLIIEFNKHYRLPAGNFPAAPMGGLMALRSDRAVSQALDIRYERNGETTSLMHSGLDGAAFAEKLSMQTKISAFLPAGVKTPPQEDAERLGQLDFEGRKQELVEFIRETIEPRLQDLSTIALGGALLIHARLEHERYMQPVACLGDGMSRLVTMMLLIATSRGSRVYIDEIENGLHYSVLPKVWEGIAQAAERFDCQVFATTHSRECIAAAHAGLPQALRDEFAYLRLDRMETGIVAKRYDFELLGIALEQDIEVR